MRRGNEGSHRRSWTVVWTDHDAAVAAGYRADAQRCRVLFDDLMLTVGQRFRRPEPRRRVRDFVRGLLAPLPSKNCWTIAKHAGDTGPDGMQDLLTRVKWDDAQVRADVRAFVGHHLGNAEAVLVIDETGDLKKSRHTVGVQRQYSGTAGLGVSRVDALAAGLPATAWQRVSAGQGAKGHRYYDWSFTALPPASTRTAAGRPGTAGPPWRSSPTPSSPPRPRTAAAPTQPD